MRSIGYVTRSTSSGKAGGRIVMLGLVPILLLFVYFWWNPFPEILVTEQVSTSHLTPVQKANIALAAQAIDGFILMPGQSFSFNKVVGPRTDRAGYAKSRSYLGPDTPMTFGGGICLLSSLLYKSALELDLPINERTAHTRTMQSLPPGFDATVWYGHNDLRFTNNVTSPLKISARVDADSLRIEWLGASNIRSQMHSSKLKRIVLPHGDNQIEVTVLREEGNKLELVSRDVYWLAEKSIERKSGASL